MTNFYSDYIGDAVQSFRNYKKLADRAIQIGLTLVRQEITILLEINNLWQKFPDTLRGHEDSEQELIGRKPNQYE